jgi:murein DD-endopeptidase MepM/ murein hydrolase activator NlpD
MNKVFLLFSILLLFLPFPIQRVNAQGQITYPTYIVQSGDTLSDIAVKFEVAIDDLIEVNGITDPNSIEVGTELKIPNQDGVTGILSVDTVNLSDNISSLIHQHRINLDVFAKINRITSPEELFAGSTIIIPTSDSISIAPFSAISSGQSPLVISLIHQLNPWNVLLSSRFDPEHSLITGDQVYSNYAGLFENNNPFITFIEAISINPLPLVQGKTTVLKVILPLNTQITGTFAGKSLIFHSITPGELICILGIPAMQEPGLYELNLKIFSAGGIESIFLKNILLIPGQFLTESIQGVDAITIDPNVIDKENSIINGFIKSTENKYWDSKFSYPVDEPCIVSSFGNRRSYNNGSYLYYHTGIDFSVCAADNLNIYAAAPGTVIFSDILEIHGLFTVIDHGWGVYSGYAHQSESYVKVGDSVETGQQIGIIGSTGRSLGPHLHWEVLINGTPVDPLDWLENHYP